MSICNLMHLRYQKTIAAPITFVGIGLHSGDRTTMRLLPAKANQGVELIRRDLPNNEQCFDVQWNAVRNSKLCTAVGNTFGHQVSTVEHLLSALYALGIDNVVIELDGPEIPILDGSALPFVQALENAGIRALGEPRHVILICRPIRLRQGASWAELLPGRSQRVTVSIDFNAHAIGTQSMSIDITPQIYREEIAPARTFGFAEQLDHLRRKGLALGGSIKNAILVREGRVANLEGLRFHDEFVRHKVLDVIGDLSLAGAQIMGHYRANRPGHQLNSDLVSLLMEDTDAWVRLPVEELGQSPDVAPGRPGLAELHPTYPVNESMETETTQRLSQRPLANRIRQIFGSGAE